MPVTARERRVCPHCSGGIEDTHHIVYACPLYSPERARWLELFGGRPSIHAFFQQPAAPLAQFAAACRRRGRSTGCLSNCPIPSQYLTCQFRWL